MRKIYTLLLLGSFVFLSPSCLIKPIAEQADPWDKVIDDDLITPIINLYAGIVEMYAISADEFIRVDGNGDLVERRRIDLTFRQFSRPVLSENVYVRVVRPTEDIRAVEFNLTKVDGEQVVFDLEDINQLVGREVSPEVQSRYGGAFNESGDKIMVPLPNNDYYNFVIFDIELNGTNSKFNSVTVDRIVEVPDLPYDLKDGLSNIRFVNGNYYATSLNGVVRITPNGQVEKIFQQWVIDVFEYDDKLYATDINTGLYESEDNGLTWDKIDNDDKPTGVSFAEVVNGQVVTQRFTGFPFDIANDDLKGTETLLTNKDFPDDVAAYNNIRYFRGGYYIAVQKQLWKADDLVVENE